MRYNIPIPDWKKRILSVIIYVFVASIFFSLLLFIGDFSIRASIVLALLFALVAVYATEISQGPQFRFCPYYVSVTPNWFQILADLKLLAKPEYWQTIQKLISEVPVTQYSLLRDKIRFTFIRPESLFTRQLVYRSTIPYHGYFTNRIDFTEDINPLSFEWRRDFEAILGKDVPRFFMRSGPDGYNLGIELPEEYWNKIRASCPRLLPENHEHAIGKIELTLATLPYSEFHLYWEPQESRPSFSEITVPQVRRGIDEQRKKFGWKTKEHADLPELAIDWPETIEHRYFTVEHREI